MGMDFLRPGLKTGMGNGIFWSEIGSGFGDAGCTPPPNILKSTPPPPGAGVRPIMAPPEMGIFVRIHMGLQVY